MKNYILTFYLYDKNRTEVKEVKAFSQQQALKQLRNMVSGEYVVLKIQSKVS